MRTVTIISIHNYSDDGISSRSTHWRCFLLRFVIKSFILTFPPIDAHGAARVQKRAVNLTALWSPTLDLSYMLFNWPAQQTDKSKVCVCVWSCSEKKPWPSGHPLPRPPPEELQLCRRPGAWAGATQWAVSCHLGVTVSSPTLHWRCLSVRVHCHRTFACIFLLFVINLCNMPYPRALLSPLCNDSLLGKGTSACWGARTARDWDWYEEMSVK